MAFGLRDSSHRSRATLKDDFIIHRRLPLLRLKHPLSTLSLLISLAIPSFRGVLAVKSEVGVVSPPHLGLPNTVKPSKPRLCHDERFLNLWIKDLSFKLDNISDLPRYVFPGHSQTTFDDKSGYQHVRLHLLSETYLGLEWENLFFVSRTLPFVWKASAFIYQNLELVRSHTLPAHLEFRYHNLV